MTTGADALDLAFNRARTDDRRGWIRRALLAAPSSGGDQASTPTTAAVTAAAAVVEAEAKGGAATPAGHPDAARRLSVPNFVNSEMLRFSVEDNARSIPSAVDGLKPSQRKVLYAALRRRLTGAEMKVAQLAGYVAETTAYHHGEAALHQTIVRMAQGFVGARNLPLLEAGGQFGTRLAGGKDAASARYIYTRLSPLVRYLFPAADDAVLPRAVEDGEAVEPVAYVPVVPLVLVNGAAGIGTGWRCDVAGHHPRAVIAAVRAVLRGEPPPPLVPWARGFRGRWVPLPPAAPSAWADPTDPDAVDGGPRSGGDGGDGQPPPAGSVAYECRGVVTRLSPSVARISELPVATWTEQYRGVLRRLLADGVLTWVTEHHTDTRVCFDVGLSPETVAKVAPGEGAAARRRQRRRPGDPLAPVAVDTDAAAAGDTAAADPDAAVLPLLRLLRLKSVTRTSLMYLYDASGVMRRYPSPAAIIDAFVPVRLATYEARRAAQIAHVEAEVVRLGARARFAALVASGRLPVSRRPVAEVVAAMEAAGLPRLWGDASGGGGGGAAAAATAQTMPTTRTGTVLSTAAASAVAQTMEPTQPLLPSPQTAVTAAATAAVAATSPPRRVARPATSTSSGRPCGR